jgi:hypothetical protein
MQRVIITGRNNIVPLRPFTSTNSGQMPDTRAARASRCFTTETRQILASVSAPQRPVPVPPVAAPGNLAARLIDGATVIGGLAVFGMMAFAFLVIA